MPWFWGAFWYINRVSFKNSESAQFFRLADFFGIFFTSKQQKKGQIWVDLVLNWADFALNWYIDGS